MTVTYLKAQIEAGAEAVQLFDTWAGELSPEDFGKFALPYYKQIFAALPKQTPKIIYIKGSAPFVEDLAEVGADILSLDWRISLTAAWKKISKKKKNTIKCLQGNLDPLYLTLPAEICHKKTTELISEGRKLGCGHILNLGHGVTPSANVAAAKAFVQAGKDT
jgi:uroporphyrinogen decarboxylase